MPRPCLATEPLIPQPALNRPWKRGRSLLTLRKLFLTTLCLGMTASVLAKNPTGNPSEFLEYCQNIQSVEYCQCTIKSNLDQETQTALSKSNEKLQQLRKQAAGYLANAKSDDPSLNKEKVDALCDIKDAQLKETGDFFEQATGNRKVYPVPKELVPGTTAIDKKYTKKLNQLLARFDTNSTSRRNFRYGGGYCWMRRMLVRAENSSRNSRKIDFVRLFKSGVEPGNSCRKVFRPPTRISEWKFDDFWQTNRLSYLIGAMYDGKMEYQPDAEFKYYFSVLQVAYDAQCRKHLPKNSVKRGFVSQVIHGDGTRETPEENSFFIDPRFVDKYDEYKRAATSQGTRLFTQNLNQSMKGFLEGRGLFKSATEQLNDHPTVQFKRFINATGCLSQDVKQLRENFLRKAYGKPSLQQQRGELPDSNRQQGLHATRQMFSACKKNPHSSDDYCSCFATKASTIMTYSEFKYYSEDLDRFYQEVIQKLGPQVPAGDRKWKLNEIHRPCAN